MIRKYIKNRYLAETVEWALAFAGMLVVFFLCRNFVFRSAVVSGPSMEPTILHGERLIVFKLPYMFRAPAKGDIIAFKYKENPSQFLVKRVIALPGDIVDIAERKITVNGAVLNDDFSGEPLISIGDARFPMTVPDGSYFVLGDNRDQSNDSRFTSVGCVKKSDMMGKVGFRYWPLDKLGIVK